MKRKITAALCAGAMASAAFASSAAITGSAEQSQRKVKIMPVGDSITDGYWEQGGYRKYMSYTLTQKGITDIDIVGPKGSDSETFEYNGQEVVYDGNYAGYSGYAIQQMSGTEARQGILETLMSGEYISTFKPDIVLLQIGTNDIISNYNEGITDRLENLINYILDEGTAGETVFVTTIPDMDTAVVSEWFWSYGEKKWNSTPEEFSALIQSCIDSYNSSIKQLAAKMQSEGKNVRFADIHSVVDMKDDLYDGVHPNESGYEKMGRYWAGVLEEFLSNETHSTETVEIPQEEYRIADLVTLGNFVLGRYSQNIDLAWKRLDLDKNNVLNGYDCILMRRKLFSL